jgi:uncharacterized membrane protein YfcA
VSGELGIAALGVASLAFVAAVCLVAGFAHGALGFGFPLLATPLVALVIDIKSAIALLAPITLVLVALSVLRGGALATLLRGYWYMPLSVALGAWLGTRLLIAAPPEPFLLVLAGVIVLYLNLERLHRAPSALVGRLRLPVGIVFGLAAGASEAVANVAGPLLLIYFMLLGLEPARIVQTLNLCFTFGKTSQVATWIGSGAMSPATWAAVGLLTIPSVGSLYLGMRVRERIDAQTYRRWLRGALAVMAALLVGQFAIATARAQESALHQAVEKGDRQTLERLLAAGADPNARTPSGETVLHYAAFPADAWFAARLIRAGADVRAVNSAGESALHWAALEANVEVARTLIEAGADANARDAKGNLPLHVAAYNGELEMVQLLLPHTARPGARNRAGASARDYALANGHAAVARLLPP